jgi:hypothetical protein
VPEYVPYLSSNLLSIKVPLLLPKGFSANLILLLWYFLGGVCLWGFEGNILALMMKKVYEDPVETAQDVVDRKLIPIVEHRFFWDFLANSDNSLYQQLANISVMSPYFNGKWDWDGHIALLKNSVQQNGTHVLLSSYLSDYERELGRYHFSQELLEGYNGYAGWFVNKKYHLSNGLAKHMLIYAQVC